MLVNTTVSIVGALLGIGSTNNNPAPDNAAANNAASGNGATSSNAAGGSGVAPAAPGAQPPVGTVAAAPSLPPLGAAARFDISPKGLRAAQLPAAAVTDRAAPIRQLPDLGDEDAARAWAIASQARESSMDVIIRIAKLDDRPWPTDKAAENALHSDTAERKTLAVA